MRERDGGAAWLVVAGAIVGHAIPFGLVVYSFTIFFPEILREFGSGQGATAWIISIATALMLGAASGAGVLTDRLGPRTVMTFSAGSIGLGLWLAAGGAALWQVALSYGVIAGLGSSMAFIPAIAAVGMRFERRRGLALGMAAAGTGIGTIVMAPLSRALIESDGWRSALRTLAVVGAVALLVAATTLPGRAPGHVPGRTMHGLGSHRSFRLLLYSSFVASFGYWVPVFFIGPYAEDAGRSSAVAAAIVATMGVANTLGRIVMGGVADRVGRLRIIQVSSASMAVGMLLWPLAHGTVPLTIFGVFYGITAGSFIALLPALAGDYFGPARIGAATGLLFASAALGTLLSAPVSGWLFETVGYPGGIAFAAGTLLVGTVPLLMMEDPAAHRTRVPAAG